MICVVDVCSILVNVMLLDDVIEYSSMMLWVLLLVDSCLSWLMKGVILILVVISSSGFDVFCGSMKLLFIDVVFICVLGLSVSSVVLKLFECFGMCILNWIVLFGVEVMVNM